VTNGQLSHVMGRLLAANQIHVATYGPKSKQRSRLALGPKSLFVGE
jgi:hypothetical protein